MLDTNYPFLHTGNQSVPRILSSTLAQAIPWIFSSMLGIRLSLGLSPQCWESGYPSVSLLHAGNHFVRFSVAARLSPPGWSHMHISVHVNGWAGSCVTGWVERGSCVTGRVERDSCVIGQVERGLCVTGQVERG